MIDDPLFSAATTAGRMIIVRYAIYSPKRIRKSEVLFLKGLSLRIRYSESVGFHFGIQSVRFHVPLARLIYIYTVLPCEEV